MMKLFLLGTALGAAALLGACGGGGSSDAGSPPPVVTSSSASSVKYGDTLLVTLAGSGLDQLLTLSSTGCRGFARSTTAPNVSSATTAYYTCTVGGATGNLSVTVAGGGVTAATVPFTVAVPQVSMLVSNGAGVAGTLVITLDPNHAPLTVDNFLAYVKSGFYNGTVIHRNSPGFVLQGGGYAGPLSSTGTVPALKATNAPIVLEDNAGVSNLTYTLAMARTGVADSATSQFFFNLANNTFLDRTASARGYAVFGSVTTGTALVDAMAAAPCQAWANLFAGECLPVPNLSFTSATQTR